METKQGRRNQSAVGHVCISGLLKMATLDGVASLGRVQARPFAHLLAPVLPGVLIRLIAVQLEELLARNLSELKGVNFVIAVIDPDSAPAPAVGKLAPRDGVAGLGRVQARPLADGLAANSPTRTRQCP